MALRFLAFLRTNSRGKKNVKESSKGSYQDQGPEREKRSVLRGLERLSPQIQQL